MKLSVLCVLATAMLLMACAPITAPLPSLAGAMPAPDLHLPTPNGDIRALSDLRGEVVFVNFWGTYCPPCVDELPDLQALQNELSSQPFTVLGVNVEERPDEVIAWAQARSAQLLLVDDGHRLERHVEASAQAFERLLRQL